MTLKTRSLGRNSTGFDIGLIECRASRKWCHASSIPAEIRKAPIVPRLNFGEDAASPRRRGDSESTPGRCANLDYCSIGMQRVLVEVPVTKPFICPECGGRLRPPGRSGLRRAWVIPALRIAILLAGIGLGTVQGYIMGRMQPGVKKAVATVSNDTLEKVNAARAMLGLRALPADAIKVAPTAAPIAASAPPLAPPPPPMPFLVADRAYPRRPPPLDTEDPPQRLADEQHFGQVVVDCAIGAIQVKPVCHVTDIRGGDAFSAAATAWLEALSVQYAPGKRDGAPALLDHRWRVIFEDFSGTAPRAKPQPAARR
jgi:hypothetical protein